MAGKLTAEEQEVLAGISSRPAASQDYGTITPEEISAVQAESVLAREYDMPVTAAALGAARGVTLGLSDVALTQSGLVKPETLRNIQEQSPFISGTTEIVGTVAPLVFSAGAATPVGVLSKAGQVAAKKVTQGIASKAAGKVAGTAVAGAVEGAGFAAGNLASKVALENEKLSAESIISHIGPGAALGGALGGVIGAGAAALPKVLKVASPLVRRVEKFGEDFIDPVKAAEDLSGLPPRKLMRMNDATEGNFSKDLLDYTKRNLVTADNPGAMADDLVASNAVAVKNAGKKIDELTAVLDNELTLQPDVLAKASPWERVKASIDRYADDLSGTAEIRKPQLKFIKQMKDVVNRLQTESELSRLAGESSGFRALNQLRRDMQDLSYNPLGTKLENFKASVAENVRSEIRKVTNDLADDLALRAGEKLAINGQKLSEVGQTLKAANKDYHIGTTIKSGLSTRAAKRDTFNIWQIAQGGDVRRNLVVLANIGNSVTKLKDAVKAATNTFFTTTKRPVLALANKGLATSGFATDSEGRAPKSEMQAFKNMQKNVTALATNQEQLLERLTKSTNSVAQISPSLAFEAQQQMVAAVEFLDSKMPKSPNQGVAELLFQKDYEPTSMELAKFRRYVQVVEQPLTVLEELENGTLTREHVEALSSVYPALYENLRLEVMEQIVAHPDMPYQKKLSLGILLDLPSDESLQPQSILGLQANFQTEGQEEPQGGGSGRASSSLVGMRKLDIAGRERTAVQDIEDLDT